MKMLAMCDMFIDISLLNSCLVFRIGEELNTLVSMALTAYLILCLNKIVAF